MIKNFAELRKQLEELSSVINSFKSEAVQLRIVELIFKGEPGEEDAQAESKSEAPQRRPRRRATKKTTARGAGKPRTSKTVARGGRKSPAIILSELIDDGFFQKKRTINDIKQYASSQKARSFKASELSSPLTRFVRDNRLKRDKNADGQYEYHKQ